MTPAASKVAVPDPAPGPDPAVPLKLAAPRRKTLAIVGNGMASARLVDDLLERGAADRWRVRVFGEERHAAYNRILLSRVLAGDRPESVSLRPAGWKGEGVEHVLGGRVVGLDTLGRTLTTADGEVHDYDAVVLATGSGAFVPPVDGHDLDGVVAYRTLDDVARMLHLSATARSAIVLGGGLLGLEAAKALLDLGLHTTVVHLGPHLMDTQLDADGGATLRRRLEAAGLFFRVGTTVQAVHDDGHGRADRVTLADGTELPADLVVMACGIRPRVELAREAGLEVGRAVVVNDTLATERPGVYAVGECAQHRGKVYGLVAPIWEQTAVLADVLSGRDPSARYGGSRLHAKLKVAGVEVASLGRTAAIDEHDRAVCVSEPDRDVYRKLIVREGRLVGAQLVGDTSAAAALVGHFTSDTPLPADPLAALVDPSCLAGAGAEAAGGDPEVCNCNSVRRSAIEAAIADGASSVEEVAARTKATTGCGSCKSQVCRLLGASRSPSK